MGRQASTQGWDTRLASVAVPVPHTKADERRQQRRPTKRGAGARWVKSAGGGSCQLDAATTSKGGDGGQRKAEAGTRKGRIRPAATDLAGRRRIQPAGGGESGQREADPTGARRNQSVGDGEGLRLRCMSRCCGVPPSSCLLGV